MKLNEKVIDVQGTMSFDETTRMSFDEGSISHIIQSLTNMYSDPYASIAREYAGNAYDSHIMACQTKPIELTLPTDLNANFTVRDFGVGMSRTELVEIYSKYGASTKRNTNDQIGAFGLGAKSALALVSSFTVISIKDGKKNTVIVSKDETGVGALNFLEEKDTDTDAENGVTVVIPVPKSYLMRDAVNGLFLGWPHGMVKVDGKLIEKTVHNPKHYAPVGKVGYVSRGTAQNDRYTNAVKVLVGPVTYNVPISTMNQIIDSNKKAKKSESLKNAYNAIVIRLENGSVDLTPSRESLIFNARTKAALLVAYEEMVNGVRDYTSQQIQGTETRREALESLSAFKAKGFSVSPTWNGEVIPVNSISIINAEKVSTTTVTTSDIVIGSPASHAAFNPSKSEFDRLPTHIDAPHTAYKGLVYSLIVTESEFGDFGYHAACKNLSAYFKAIGFEKNRKVKVFTTSLKASDLNVWAVASADSVMTSEEIMEVVRKQRREAQALRKLEGVERVVVNRSLQLPIAERFTGTNGKPSTFKIKTVSISELPENTKYVVISASGTQEKNKSVKNLEEALYVYLRGRSSFGSYRGTIYTDAFLGGVVQMLVSSGYTLVSLPESRNAAKVISELPNSATLSPLLDTLILKGLTSLTEVEKEWVASMKLSRRNSKWIGAVIGGFDAVENKETREWLALASNKRGKMINSLFQLSFGVLSQRTINEVSSYYRNAFNNSVATTTKKIESNWGEKSEISTKLIEFATSLVETEGRSYPLLQNLYVCDDYAAIIEYINFKDAARKA